MDEENFSDDDEDLDPRDFVHIQCAICSKRVPEYQYDHDDEMCRFCQMMLQP